MSNKPSMLSIRKLFSGNDHYIIPIYQRNYAWKLPQLRQLVQDIWDSCNYNPDRNYYIGSLVIYPTVKGYETVDGQQRLTTLNIMLSAMKNELEDSDNPYPWVKGCNVDFEFREKSSDSLQKLYAHDSPASIEDDTIAYMYEQVRPIIEDVLDKNSDPNRFTENFAKFREYLFDKVIIIKVPLPSETDLNHYFEIMNTRGEQLEKHEILKARILNPLKEDEVALWLGNRIWEACSDMSKYVQMGFTDTGLRRCVFSDDLNTITAQNFDALVASTVHLMKKENDSLFSINDILESGKFADKEQADAYSALENEADVERFTSVIDFPNFLLQVLRVITGNDIPLDDKRLLSTFPQQPDREFSINFLYQLLRIRYLFDKFIIRRDLVDERRKGKWSILKLKVYEKDRGLSYNNTFDKNQRENIMLQSMFHVSLPSQNYKHWLCGALLHLSKNNDGQGLYEYMTQLSHAYMLDRFLLPGDSQSDYYDIIFKNDGKPMQKCPKKLVLPRFDTNIDIFFFNFLDMQLWLNGNEPDFTFTARNSIEHLYPQHPMDNFPPITPDRLHSFGNLCLIGSGKNSRLSNFPPIQKTEFYEHSPIDSIKQKLMMEICKRNVNKNKEAWNVLDIENHENDMEAVIIKSLSGNSPAIENDQRL